MGSLRRTTNGCLRCESALLPGLPRLAPLRRHHQRCLALQPPPQMLPRAQKLTRTPTLTSGQIRSGTGQVLRIWSGGPCVRTGGLTCQCRREVTLQLQFHDAKMPLRDVPPASARSAPDAQRPTLQMVSPVGGRTDRLGPVIAVQTKTTALQHKPLPPLEASSISSRNALMRLRASAHWQTHSPRHPWECTALQTDLFRRSQL